MRLSQLRSHCHVVALLSAVTAVGTAAQPYESFSGRAMGTTYTVKIAHRSDSVDLGSLATDVQRELERTEQIFSLFRPDSELSRLNKTPAHTWIDVSSDLHVVAIRALLLSERTGGAFDPTVGPLIRLWRINDISPAWTPPSAAAIVEAKQRVGAHQVEIRAAPPAIRKLAEGIELDLNALVEGWALDQLAALLRVHDCRDFLIELGGEFRASGQRGDGQPWRVGIEDPRQPRALYANVALEDAALATSGDYRHARQHNGASYSHIIDPRTGAPIRHDLTAVSVLAPDGITADAWATALMVLGPEAGREIAEREGLAASFVLRSSLQAPPLFTSSAERLFRRSEP